MPGKKAYLYEELALVRDRYADQDEDTPSAQLLHNQPADLQYDTFVEDTSGWRGIQMAH